jgi:hypothetical protein
LSIWQEIRLFARLLAQELGRDRAMDRSAVDHAGQTLLLLAEDDRSHLDAFLPHGLKAHPQLRIRVELEPHRPHHVDCQQPLRHALGGEAFAYLVDGYDTFQLLVIVENWEGVHVMVAERVDDLGEGSVLVERRRG